jgi:hypothetical protein
MPVFVDRERGPVLAVHGDMTCSWYALVVLVAAACGGAVSGDGSGGGPAAGGNGGTVSAGGAGNGTGGRTDVGGASGTGGTSGVGGTSGSGGTASVDAAACGVIRASDYDQSCKTTPDCTAVVEGDTCAMQCDCPNATINQTALAKYHPVYAGSPIICPCPLLGVPTCISGVCTMCPPWGCVANDGGGTLDAGYDALPKNCIDQWGGGQPAVCCPEPAPDCQGKPDGYPGYGCVERQNQFCSCQCQGGAWICAC